MHIRAFSDPIPPTESLPPAPAERGFWRTGVLLVTSAALGGIAVALWNRRTLAQMREPPAED